MENIVNAIHIPENITQAGLAHCKEYLGRALDHMILTPTTSAMQDRLAAQFRTLTTTLRERTTARPKHHTMNPSALGQNVLANAPTTEAKELKEAVIQTNIKFDQLRLDLEQLATSITANEWTCSENHIFTWGMEARSTWRDQHATISSRTNPKQQPSLPFTV